MKKEPIKIPMPCLYLKSIARPYQFAILYKPDPSAELRARRIRTNEQLYEFLRASGLPAVTIIPGDAAMNYGPPVEIPTEEFIATWQGD